MPPDRTGQELDHLRRLAETGASDKWAKWLLERRFGGDRAQLDQTLEFLAPVRDRVLDGANICDGDTVLDLGAGDGLIAFGAVERVGNTGQVIFSDISSDLLEHRRELAVQIGVVDCCGFVEASADDLSPISDESIDAVTSRSVLIFVDEKERAFQESYRVLRPGARLSIYEPINRISIAQSDREFTGGFAVGPVQDIARKVEAVFRESQPVETDSMLNFDERDLLGWLELAGFQRIEMDYEVRIGPVTGMPWETYLNTAFNPRMPTLNEAMDRVLSAEERDQFAAHLRPLVERGERRFRLGVAYIRAIK